MKPRTELRDQILEQAIKQLDPTLVDLLLAQVVLQLQALPKEERSEDERRIAKLLADAGFAVVV